MFWNQALSCRACAGSRQVLGNSWNGQEEEKVEKKQIDDDGNNSDGNNDSSNKRRDKKPVKRA